MSYKLYGIKNCDTVKKVRKNLGEKGVEYEFMDFKLKAPTKTWLKNSKKQIGELLVNKKGPTYRKIKDDFEIASAAEQLDLLVENSSAIKRPILEKNGVILVVGNDQEALAKIKS